MVACKKYYTLNDLISQFRNSSYAKKTAVIDRKEFRSFAYTYEELYSFILKFSSFLKKNKLKKGDKIILWMQNSVEYPIILFGSLLAGVIVVPIDLKSGPALVKKIQKKVQAKIIFQTQFKPPIKTLIKSKRINIKTVFTEQILNLIKSLKPKQPQIKISQKDIAEIIYTSGTTGKPKGVILTHKNFVSNLKALNQVEKVTPKFKFLSLLPLSHVFEQMVGLFVPLSNYSTIVYVKTLKLSSLLEAFQQEKITHTVVVPRLLDLIRSGIMQEISNKNKQKQFHFTLKITRQFPYFPILKKIIFHRLHQSLGGHFDYFICGGASLDPELEKFYYNLGLPIVQGYGLTETSPVLTTNLIDKRKIGSVGKPLPNIKLKIDQNTEILAQGPSMTKGYYKNKQLTNELFKNNWLRTCDLGYLDQDNFLYIKGRLKNLIVTSAGVNVYPQDIEEVLNRIEGVRDSCVIGLESKSGGNSAGRGEEIHAVLLLKDQAKTQQRAKKIIAQANKKLETSQKIQNYTLWMEEDFPRTTTMKIKKFLVKQGLEGKTKQSKIVGKKNKVQALLSRLTEKQIIKNSTLQELGLSSIDRVELISLLEQEFNLEIDEEKISSQTKVRQLEKLVKTRKVVEKKKIYKKWSLSIPCKIIRFLVQKVFVFPLVIFFSRPFVEGREHLKNIKGPVIFAANHQSHLDTPLILMKLPFRFLTNIAIAAWQGFFFRPDLDFRSFSKKILFYLSTIFFNIYPFPKKKGFRKSIKYTGYLIDHNWNILIYPEGVRSKTGQLAPFKTGIGILALEMKVPIVPVKIENALKILPPCKMWPRFNRAKVKFGKPLYIKEDSSLKATQKIEKAVKKL